MTARKDPAARMILMNRFRSALPEIVGSAQEGQLGLTCLDIIERYEEPHREYHTVEHVCANLDLFDEVKKDIDIRLHRIIELALIYLHAVYDPASEKNVDECAQLAQFQLLGLGLPVHMVIWVTECIVGTTHVADLSRGKAAPQWVADIDLLSLAVFPESFDRNSEKIRAEHFSIPGFTETRWAEGRKAFLKRMLAKKPLYYNQAYREKYEEAAKHNLRRHLRSYAEAAM